MTRSDPVISIATVDEALARRGLGLSFPAQLEACFRRETLTTRCRTLLICTFISCLLYPIFLISDYKQIPDVFGYMVAFRLLGFLQLSAILAYILWKHPTSPLIEPLGSLIAFLSVFMIIIALELSASPFRANYIPGFMIGMIYGTVVHRPRFKYSLGLVASIILISTVFLVQSEIVDQGAITRHTLFFITGGMLMLMASYTFEHATRQAFLHGLRGRLLNQLLEKAAMTDPLTELGNRRYFEHAVDRVWSATAAADSNVAIIMLDLDYFKLFNDANGHIEGDRCLAKVAGALRAVLRPNCDELVRYGGEEFVVLMPQSDLATARMMAESLRLAIRRLSIPNSSVAGEGIVTASVGVAAGNCRWDSSFDLLVAADRALYRAKGDGRDCVRVADKIEPVTVDAKFKPDRLAG